MYRICLWRRAHAATGSRGTPDAGGSGVGRFSTEEGNVENAPGWSERCTLGIQSTGFMAAGRAAAQRNVLDRSVEIHNSLILDIILGRGGGPAL